MITPRNDKAWSLPSIVNYFQGRRKSTQDIYPSEWVFLKDILKEGISILDVGCAVGGFAKAVGENLKQYSYTGMDISAAMIDEAKRNLPQHRFFHVNENDFSCVRREKFDLVLCLGILPLSEHWRETIEEAWKATRHYLLLDIREHTGPSIEDKKTSFLKMDFGGVAVDAHSPTLPYNVINSCESVDTILRLCPNYARLSRHGYLHPVTGSATCPIQQVFMNTYLVEKQQ